MQSTITPLNKFNFNDAVTLIAGIMNNSGIPYKRAEAVSFLVNTKSETMVLEYGGSVMGMYSYIENPNEYSLNFFALNPFVRGKRSGYALYDSMKKKLKGKPVIVPIASDNADMLSIVKKRGIFIGRFTTDGSKVLDYFSINFGDKEWVK